MDVAKALWMSPNRYLKSRTLQFYSVYQSDTTFLIIPCKDNANLAQDKANAYVFMVGLGLSYVGDVGDTPFPFNLSTIISLSLPILIGLDR